MAHSRSKKCAALGSTQEVPKKYPDSPRIGRIGRSPAGANRTNSDLLAIPSPLVRNRCSWVRRYWPVREKLITCPALNMFTLDNRKRARLLCDCIRRLAWRASAGTVSNRVSLLSLVHDRLHEFVCHSYLPMH